MSGIDRESERFESHPKSYLASRTLLVVGFFVALVAVLAIGDYGFSWWAAPWQGKLEARQQIQSGNYRIAAYTQFFDECASVQSLDVKIETQIAVLHQFKKGSNDYTRTVTNIAGIKAARGEAINQYNADAAKSYTVGQFRASNLPYQLPTTPYKKGEQITCAS